MIALGKKTASNSHELFLNDLYLKHLHEFLLRKHKDLYIKPKA